MCAAQKKIDNYTETIQNQHHGTLILDTLVTFWNAILLFLNAIRTCPSKTETKKVNMFCGNLGELIL